MSSLLVVTGPPGAGKSTAAQILAGARPSAGHGFTDEPATRKMHAEFADSDIAARHVIRDPPGDVADVVALIGAMQTAGDLHVDLR